MELAAKTAAASEYTMSIQAAGTPGHCAGAGEERLGLFRQEWVGSGRAITLQNLFRDLRDIGRGEFIGEDAARGLQGTRVFTDRAEGHGSVELYKLGKDIYLVAADNTYDFPRIEHVPGEGLIEFHLRLSGVLEMTLPGRSEPLIATGPCLTVLYQPSGVAYTERTLPNRRDEAVSLYCRPDYIAKLLHRNSVAGWPPLEQIIAHRGRESVWYRSLPLSPGLMWVAKSLLKNRYRHGIRLLHAQAKAFELLCEVLTADDAGIAEDAPSFTATEMRQLGLARRLLATRLSSPPRLAELARIIGMSQSKLKRSFKARYGVTVCEFGLECRMRHALHLLQAQHLSVDQVSREIGYRHQTSLSAAFREHFGFLPSSARNAMQ